MPNRLMNYEMLTDHYIKLLMQQVHDKEIIISLGLNEGEAGALIGADLTKLKTPNDQMHLSIALLTAFFKLNADIDPERQISYLMSLVNIVITQTATQHISNQIH